MLELQEPSSQYDDWRSLSAQQHDHVRSHFCSAAATPSDAVQVFPYVHVLILIISVSLRVKKNGLNSC